MSSRDKRLRALYHRFLADQDFYRRCYARSMAEAAHHARERALPDVGNSEALKIDSAPPANEGE